MTERGPIITLEGVIVDYDGFKALNNLNFIVDYNELRVVIGPNGAGKTTYFNVITGLQHPTSGRVTLDGRDVTDAKPHRRARLGIARTFQRLEAFGSLSARENVLVAAEMRRRWANDPMSPADLAQHALEQVGIVSVADVTVDALPTGTARLVELARALATDPKVLLLDEPSSGLDEQETDALGVLLHELTAGGLAVLLVEHDMPLVMEACSYISVLDFGRVIARGTPHEIQGDPAVQTAYLGTTAGAGA